MALSANVVWEVRTDGDDNNGGGFNSASSGTDYSQQAAAQLTVTDAATSAVGSTTLTSATGGFTAAMVGNVVHLYGGTNLTAGWYEITGYTDGNTVTLDRAPDDGVGGVSGATCKVGGALASPGALSSVWVSGNVAWIREGTYTLTTATAGPGGPIYIGGNGAEGRIMGYGTNRGDGGVPTIDVGSVANINVVSTSSYEIVVRQLRVNGRGNSGITGFHSVTAELIRAHNCIAENCDLGFYRAAGVSCIARGGSRGYNQGNLNYCVAEQLSGRGYSDPWTANHCVANACYDGIYIGYSNSVVVDCIAYNCTSHGFPAGYGQGTCANCIAVNNGGYGFADGKIHYRKCAGYGNASGTHPPSALWVDMDAFIAITGDPFIDAANGDFRLNDTAGAGAVLRGAGLGVYGQTDNQDVGAVQHSDPAGGGGGDIWPYIRPRRIGA